MVTFNVSLVHHGFQKLLFVNGHGSNHHLVEQATRQIMLQYPAARAAMLVVVADRRTQGGRPNHR